MRYEIRREEEIKQSLNLQTSDFRLRSGFTLLEVIAAIFLITVGIIGSYSLITQTISSSTFSKDKLIAAYLAQEGIEIVRNIRDTNWLERISLDPANLWDEGLTNCSGVCDGTTGNGCMVDYNHSYSPADPYHPVLPQYTGDVLNIDSNGFYSYSTVLPFTPTKFKRKVVINPNGSDILNVCVYVEWQEKGITHSTVAREDLYQWRY